MTEEKKDKEGKEEENDVFPFIEGERIDLVAGNSKWANLFCNWINNPKVRHYSRNIQKFVIILEICGHRLLKM
jgi:hypothetical protein